MFHFGIATPVSARQALPQLESYRGKTRQLLSAGTRTTPAPVRSLVRGSKGVGGSLTTPVCDSRVGRVSGAAKNSDHHYILFVVLEPVMRIRSHKLRREGRRERARLSEGTLSPKVGSWKRNRRKLLLHRFTGPSFFHVRVIFHSY